jgi:hypothetical protein
MCPIQYIDIYLYTNTEHLQVIYALLFMYSSHMLIRKGKESYLDYNYNHLSIKNLHHLIGR